ncbi:putative YAP-binding/ALF4/Glomulin [Dioscorea sansibarensis]
MDIAGIHVADASSPSLSTRLQASLQSIHDSFESGDFRCSDEAIASTIALLDPTAESLSSDAEEALSIILSYLSSPSSSQMVVEALSLELPKVVVKLAGSSDECRAIAGAIVDRLVSVSSAREMLLVLCEALHSHIKVSKAPIDHVLLLSRLPKVLNCIQRHHVEQVKVALPAVLEVLYAISSESDEEDDSLDDMFCEAILFGKSIQAQCQKLDGRRKEELCAILGLYVLQNMALISRSRLAHNTLNCVNVIKQVSEFLPFCGLSYVGLLTGTAVDTLISKISIGVGDDFMTCFSFSMIGASLTVMWGHTFEEVAKAAGEEIVAALNILWNDNAKRWQAIGMFKHTLASIDYTWEMKLHCIELLSSILDGGNSDESSGDEIQFSSFTTTIFAALQGIQRFIIGASKASSRKKAFNTFQKVLSDIPTSFRLDMLRALITNSDSPSMIAILIDIVRGQMVTENNQGNNSARNQEKSQQNGTICSPFWSYGALELVELVLRPPKGGPPTLPEDSEAVLSALNLYRFILIAESTGKTNHTGVMSSSNLRKAYEEWLLPLRTLLSGIQSENSENDSELADNILCALNPVQFVLHRCIDLVEECMKSQS